MLLQVKEVRDLYTFIVRNIFPKVGPMVEMVAVVVMLFYVEIKIFGHFFISNSKDILKLNTEELDPKIGVPAKMVKIDILMFLLEQLFEMVKPKKFFSKLLKISRK